jgi:hypothetical protein
MIVIEKSHRGLKGKEKYLFMVAKKVLDWAEVEYKPQELADLVMLDLLEIKEEE